MKVSILGAGDVTKIHRFGKVSEEEARQLLDEVGMIIARKGMDLVCVPARGIPYEVAKAYRAAGGRKVIGVVPRDDKRYGIKHIQDYMDIMDEEINIGNWYDLNGEIAAQGDFAVCIGMSSGAMIDIAMMKYHYKYLGSKTRIIIFENTISQRLPKEI
ncbi:MAG: hypothetical protein QW112_00740 [Candidatus Micrarchaeia archaeon]